MTSGTGLTLQVLTLIAQLVAPLPLGYRYPTGADVSDAWAALAKELPEPYVTRADFDGNGHVDEAWLLLRKRGGFGLFVFMTLPGRPPHVLWLAGARSGAAQGHVVAAARAGRHQTACAKGYGSCGPNEPATLVLEHPGIEFSRFESSSSIFWWNTRRGAFERTWISD